jgi:hypothetical protein
MWPAKSTTNLMNARRHPSAGSHPERHHRNRGAMTMKRFIIEREIPGASELTEAQLAEITQTSNRAAQSLGVPYRWITSYVAGDKIYCVHEADDEDTVREHARRGGFPADAVTPVACEFGPATAR